MKPGTEMDEELTAFKWRQYNLAVETFRAQLELLVQILSAFVLANVTVIGFAVAGQKAGIFLVGAMIPLMMLIVIRSMERFMLPIIYTALAIEEKYAPKDETNLVGTFVRLSTSVVSLEQLKQTVKVEEASKQGHQAEISQKVAFRLVNRRQLRFLLVILCIGQIATAIFLYLVFNWQLF